MANIIEEYLDKRGYAYTKSEKLEEKYPVKRENYELSGNETLDGLKLVISIETLYNQGGIPYAQDFIIRSNRGVMRRTTAYEVFEVLRMFL